VQYLRSRMAGEIHDSLAQAFTSIALQTEAMLSEVDERSLLRESLSVVEETARIGLAEARSSVLALRPLGEGAMNLERALEALANALRHAEAKQVVIHFDVAEPWATLSIRDDGVGIGNASPSARSGLGLPGMRARAAALGVRSLSRRRAKAPEPRCACPSLWTQS
jgi:signal transduction histidine kinase